jgi:hypothetical protein
MNICACSCHVCVYICIWVACIHICIKAHKFAWKHIHVYESVRVQSQNVVTFLSVVCLLRVGLVKRKISQPLAKYIHQDHRYTHTHTHNTHNIHIYIHKYVHVWHRYVHNKRTYTHTWHAYIHRYGTHTCMHTYNLHGAYLQIRIFEREVLDLRKFSGAKILDRPTQRWEQDAAV